MINRENKIDNKKQAEFLMPLFNSMQKMNQALEEENVSLKKELLALKSSHKKELNCLIEKLEVLKGNIN